MVRYTVLASENSLEQELKHQDTKFCLEKIYAERELDRLEKYLGEKRFKPLKFKIYKVTIEQS